MEDDQVAGKGYDVELLKELYPGYKCPYCELVMRDPIQTMHGERACRTCYLTLWEGDASLQIFTDKLAQREINNLECFCIHKKNGCPWIGTISHFEEHARTCEYQPVKCQQCLEFVSKVNMEIHRKELCPRRVEECSYCREEFSAEIMKIHQNACPKQEIPCTFKCGKYIVRDQMTEHASSCVAIEEKRICPYTIFGCDSFLESEVDKHISYATVRHCSLLTSKIDFIETSTLVLSQSWKTLQNRCQDLENYCGELKKKTDILNDALNNYKSQYDELKQTFLAYKEEMEQKISQFEKYTDLPNSPEEALAKVEETCEEANRKLIKLSSSINEYTKKGEEKNFRDLEKRIKLSSSTIEQVERNYAMLNATVADLELKAKLLDTISYDGVQIWKVDNVRYRRDSAKSGKSTAIHSPPCFTSRGGYRFCTRLYLNGDGMGKGSHLSLFFVLMKSDFDELNEWPFSMRVSFELINPKNRETLSHRETFMPDKNSSSFQKPTKDMNVAAGCPMFITLDKLENQNFIIDDCIFIKTVVKSTERTYGSVSTASGGASKNLKST